jgi:hypothetical protein
VKKVKPRRTSSFRAIEVFLMALALGWGIGLLAPYPTFDSSPTYQAMSGMANENTWGVGMLLVAMIHFIAMYYNSKPLKQISLNLSGGVWFFVTAMLSCSGILATETICYFLIGSLSAWVAIKVGVQK